MATNYEDENEMSKEFYLALNETVVNNVSSIVFCILYIEILNIFSRNLLILVKTTYAAIHGYDD